MYGFRFYVIGKFMRRIVWSISLLVLLLNTLWTPLTYAEEYSAEVVVESNNDIQTDEVVEQKDGDEQSPEFPVNENFDNENEENSVEVERGTTITWDAVEEWTWEVSEIGSWEIEELTGDTVVWDTWAIVEELTWFIDELTWFSVELTWEMTGSTVTGEETEVEEIKYNEKPILWEKAYNDVTVKVEALTWIFPEWTELIITPIKWWNLSNLKDKLVEEQEEVKEDTTVVAFDITFIYSWEEVQPKEWEKVKVTFDYSKNEDLLEADKNDNQEIKVYHIEDKDEEWNKLEDEEKKIKDVTSVKESEEEWIAVAEWETFSIYAIVTTTWNPNSVTIIHNLNGWYWMEDHSMEAIPIVYTCNNNSCETTTHYKTPSKTWYMFMWWIDGSWNRRKDGVAIDNMNVYAKWQKFWDLDVYILNNEVNKQQYTLMDRNMWALDRYNKSTSINDESRGYYYQWWNNYGFDSHYENDGAISIRTKQRVDVDNYSWESPYYSFRFYVNWAGDANWMNNITTKKDLWWDITKTQEARQWPCPDGYYIPTKDDWISLLNSWSWVNSREYKNFYFDLLMPSAWIRDRWYKKDLDSYVVDIERYRYISSSWNWDNFNAKAVIVLTQTDINKLPIVSTKASWWDTTHERSANGLSLRCFKNDSNTYGSSINISNIHLNWWQKAIISIASWEVVSLQNPTRNADQFRWWYTTSDYSWNPIWVWSWLESWDYLYAKWCSDWLVDDGTSCVEGYSITFDTKNWSSVSTQIVPPWATWERPEDPIKDWYTFEWWYPDEQFISEFDFDTPITSNITLYAKWNLITYTIDYNLNGWALLSGKTNPEEYTIESGTITLNNPIRDWYVFEWWSWASIDWLSWTVTISQWSTWNRVYEAIWWNIKYDLSFDSLWGSPVPTQRIIEWETWIRPTDPTRDWYTFEWWYWTWLVIPFDFTLTAITGDITLYAKWHINSFTVTFDAGSNWWTTLTWSIEIASWSTLELDKYTATPTDSSYQFIWWSENPNSSVILQTDPVITSNKTLYAVFSKEISATFNANWNKLDNANDNITKSCTVYNKENNCNITTPIVSNAITTTVVWYTTSQEWASSSNTWSNVQINISWWEVYYAQTMTPEKVLTWSVNGNNSTLSSYDPISCTLTGVFNGEIQATSCEVDMPTITPHTNTKTVVWWNTTANSTTNNSSFNTNTNKLRLTVENTKQIWYAITTAPEVRLSITYQKWTWVESIWENLSWCTIEATYNWNPQATTCTVKAPTITVKLWYNEENKRWKKVWWDDEKSEWDTITLDKSETYEASTNINTYTIEYILNDWNVELVNPTSYTVESSDFTLNNPTREGYIFEWWSWTNLTDKTINVTIPSWSIWDRVYEANWKAIDYTITYNLNSGTVAVVNPVSYTIESWDISLNNPTREGYTFEWWSWTNLTDKTINVTIPSWSIWDRVYEANWKAIDYTITYNLNSGTVAVVNPASYTIESWDISLNNPTRTWYTFEWWSWTNLPDKTINVTIRNWSTWDRAYEANWEANKYEVRYKANGWEWDDLAEEAIYDTKYVFTGNIFTREWYTFKEWNTKADWSGSWFAEWFSWIWKTATWVNLYAIWKINKYIVTYDAASHSWTINSQPISWETVEYNTEIRLPSENVVSEKWYQFSWWTTTLGWTEPISSTYMVTNNVTFYPIFKKDWEQKDITFYKNWNSWYRYENQEYTVDRAFSGCSIPTLYNTDADIVSCSVHITLPDIIAHENTPTVLWWSTWAEERTISYATWVVVTIIIPRGKEVELYAQTRSVEKEYTATYKTDSRVEEVEEPSDTCRVPVTYNGNPQQITCTEAITLPNILAKLWYNTPIWKLWETEYDAWSQVYLSWNVSFTGTATPDAQTPYTVKHYYQTIANTGTYEFSWSDILSWATETQLVLSKLQKNPLENTWFTYYQARVNSGSSNLIDIRNIDDFEEKAKIQPWLVIQLFYTRNNNTLTLNTIEHATVKKAPEWERAYYGEKITFNGTTEEWYTFSWWSIEEWDNEPQTILWETITYTMPSTGVVITPLIREHSYTIHYDANWAEGSIQDQSTLYSETVILPTAEQVAEQLTNTWHHFVWWTTWATETTVLTELSKATAVDNGEVTLYAKWDVNDWTQYLVKYYLEPVEELKPRSEYVLQDTFTWAAPTNSVITWVLKNYDWFTAPLELTWKVAADGSLVIKYYYTRNSYTYIFNAWEWAEFEDWTDSTGLSFRYEQAVNEPGLSVVKPWFTKIWWTPELSVTMPHENKTSTVVWSENHYTIEYDANWWDWETPTQSNIAYTESISLTWNQFVKEWYYFAWWSITKDWGVIYWDKAVVSGLTWVNNAIVKLYAHWEADWYIVTFDANSWDVSETGKNVIYDGTYWVLPEANRVWYTFNWWFTEKISWVKITEDTKVTIPSSHTLYAHWTANKYIVTFNANGWAVSQSTGEVTFDEKYWVLPTPTRIWYTFVWWYTEGSDPVKVTEDTKVTIPSFHTLYAQWTANKYIVTFNANEWAVSQSTGEVTYNQSYWVLPVATREGYTFSWWYTQAEEWEYITWTTTVTRTENHTLYAQWKANTYTVTFDANSWDVSETEKEVIFDEIYWELPIPNRTGYTFQWWYTAKDWWTQVIQSTQVTTANDHTLYAHWLENHYIIAFNANGWEGSMSSLTSILYTETTVLPANKFTRNWYQFNWWSITDVWEVKYSDKAEVSKLTWEDNATVTLYAVWQKWAYNISYELNGWVLTWEKTNPVGYDVDTETFTLNNPEKDGYDFLWWSWTGIIWLSTTVIITQWSTWNRVYEANWKPTEYTITYNLSWWELPSGQINPVTYTIESGDITLINPVRTGYDFNWWSGTAIEWTGETVTITHWSTWDRVYEANWKIKKYTITWENSTWVILKQEILPYWVTPDYGGIPTSWADAQYTYTFKSWDPVLAPVTEDQVYTATYNKTLNTYIITFKNEDGTVLYTTWVAYWNTPVFSWADPQKAADAQYTYTFNWWSPALDPVTWEATYTATYTHTINKYTITFVDENGSELKAWVKYDYWTVSWDIAQPDEPIKTWDAHYSYTFKWWNPELTGVTKDQVYTAVYNQTINSYPITFYDEDWTTILQWPTLYPYWTLTWVIVPLFTPTKTSDGTYTYEFDKWTPILETVVGTANYTATYKSTYIDYLVTFLDSTWAVLTSGYYHSWDTVTIPASPAKASTAQTGYTFKSWYPEVQVVTWNITYEPTYTETTRSYTITWLSSTWTELRKETLPYWSTPNYGENPTSWSTAEYDYTFNWWAPAIQTVTKDATYTATYNSIKRIYPITWKDADGTEIWVTNVEYGVVPLAPTIPSKDFTEQTWYVFNWWNPAPVSVTKAATYTATYAEYTREYTILWKDYDWTVIKTWENIPYNSK